jgi:cytochrome b561
MQQAAAQRYALSQILLHWSIVGLVIVQWLASDAMSEFFERVEDDEAGPVPDDPVALLHAGSGALILILTLVRLGVRMRKGAPPLPLDMPAGLKLLARLNHWAFYLVLVLLPLSGAASLFLTEDAAGLHNAGTKVLLLLVATHLAGVAYHTLIRRDALIWRMLRPRPAGNGQRDW